MIQLPRPVKSWRPRCLPEKISEQNCKAIASQLQVPLPIITLLCQRGFADAEQIELFLQPSLKDLPSPFCMKDMHKAVHIVADALNRGLPITIYGDYDVDGVTGTAILVLFLRSLGAEVNCYQPDRLHEGYGLNIDAIKKLSLQYADRQHKGLLITVDCGISDVQEVKEAGQVGFTVIITDHHKPPPKLPAAEAIINPLQTGCAFPFKHLAGAGVAFYLAMGLRSHLHKQGYWQAGQVPNLKAYLDLVALGTIADMVPLYGLNRIFVKAGLEVMENNPRPGLGRLLEVAGINRGAPTAEDIAYRIGPRLNAMGRTGKADNAVQLLITDDTVLAGDLAVDLEEANQLRKTLQQQLFDEAAGMAAKAVEANPACKSLVLSNQSWHPGVLGIVAAKLTESFIRPTILFSIAGDKGKGSGRSIPGLDLFDVLTACGDLLEQFGGHEGAAGLTIAARNIASFQERFEQIIGQRLQPDDLEPKLAFDYRISLQELSDSVFLEYYSRLSPFGIGNPEPVFVCTNAELRNPRIVGANHLKFLLRHNRVSMPGIGFGLGHLLEQVAARPIDLAINLRQNTYRGEEHWELNLIDIKLTQHTGIWDKHKIKHNIHYAT